ncbi:TOBE domain-containing protein [Methylocella sp.]|uniref:TOBE domain-containing protein n=1 Tax=Methylocella sp. TaxID=1978226 RepID=UPI00378320C5
MARVSPAEIDTQLSLKANGKLLVGRERVTLLEAVIAHGSITRAAEATGFSYKTAWDAVNAINNLLPRPAFITHTGGQNGGGVTVTEEGRRLLAAFRSLEARLGRISAAIAAEGFEDQDDFALLSLAMKHSARNAFHCVACEITPGPLSARVRLETPTGLAIVATVANASLAEMGLRPGAQALALVPAAAVTIAAAGRAPLAVDNRLSGRVVARFDSGLESEASVDVGGGKTVVAFMSSQCADAAHVAPGVEVVACFCADRVILASD